jgi:hypothetical protein
MITTDTTKSLYVFGVCDPKDNYAKVHHIGPYNEVKKSFNAMSAGAEAAGLNKDVYFLLSYPLDEDTIKFYKISEDFVKFFNRETLPFVTN